MTPQMDLDPGRTKLIYDFAAERYLRSLPPEHFMESTPQATQRKITLESFDLIRVSRPDIQCFNELLVQYPRVGEDPDKPGQIVPDNMVVIHNEPIQAESNFAIPLQPVGPFLVLEYVSKYSVRKDYEISYEKYERELRVPYYLVFYPDADELSLFQLGPKKYSAVRPNAEGRLAIPSIDLEVALHDGWMRFWFHGELLPLPGDLLLELNAVRLQLNSAQAHLKVAIDELDSTKSDLNSAIGELNSTKSDLNSAIGELNSTRERLNAEAAAKHEAQRRAEAAEAELTRLKEELSRMQRPGA